MMGLFTYLFFMLVSERTLCPSGFPAHSTNKDHRPASTPTQRCRPVFPLTAKGDVVTVAECVENAEDAAILANEGVNLLQGYYFGKPEVSPAWRLESPVLPERDAKPAPHGPERRRAVRS